MSANFSTHKKSSIVAICRVPTDSLASAWRKSGKPYLIFLNEFSINAILGKDAIPARPRDDQPRINLDPDNIHRVQHTKELSSMPRTSLSASHFRTVTSNLCAVAAETAIVDGVG